jgi:hypothetical protein
VKAKDDLEGGGKQDCTTTKRNKRRAGKGKGLYYM